MVHVKHWLPVLIVVFVLPSIAAAQTWEDYDYENLEFRGLGLELGGIWPTKLEPTFGFGIRADLGLVGPNVRISPAIRYWSSSLRQVEVDRLSDQIRRICERQAGASCPGFDLGEIRRSDLEVSVDAHYLFELDLPVLPYAGAGVGLHLLNGRGEAISGTFVEDLLDTLSPGVNLVGGLTAPFGPSLQLFSEARLVLASDVQFANLLIGGMWSLPTAPANPFRANRRFAR
ncbi:hypothetical protein BH23GEM6_BH23GEM6_17140 [soil metagenome]